MTPEKPQAKRVFQRHHADVDIALLENPVLREQAFNVIDAPSDDNAQKASMSSIRSCGRS